MYCITRPGCLLLVAVAAILSLEPLAIEANQDEERPKEKKDILNVKGELTPAQVHKVKFEAGMTYTIDMIAETEGFDPYLVLLDSLGNELARDDDSGGDLNARIAFRCQQAETYQVVATVFKKSPGKYKLTIRAEKSASLPMVALKLKDGLVQVEGKLAQEDLRDRVRKSSVCQIFTVKMSEGKTYQIDMQKVRGFLDPYLRLEDDKGQELAKDDDSGGNLNARIVFECSREGTYRIIATTFAGGTGPFILRVQEK